MTAAWLITAALVAVAAPPQAPEHVALANRLAKTARTLVPGSLEAAAGPDCGPYRWFTFRDADTGRAERAAIAAAGEVVLAGDEVGLAKLLGASRALEARDAAGVLERVAALHGSPPTLDAAAIAALPEAERAAVSPPRVEEEAGAQVVTGFVRQGEELFRLEVRAGRDRARIAWTAVDELLGRDAIEQAVRALKSADELVRAAAVLELAGRRDPRAFDALGAALADSSSPIRVAAAEALERQCAVDAALSPRAATALRKRLSTERDPEVRDALRRTLGVVVEAPAPTTSRIARPPLTP